MSARVVALGDIIRVQYGKALKAEDRDETGSFPVYGANGLVGHHSSRIVNHTTLIIGRKGSVGAVTYAPEGGWPIDTAFYVEAIQPNDIDWRYLYYALINADLQRHVISTSIPGLNRNDIYRKQIPLPPLPDQRRIAAILDAADALRAKRRAALAKLDALGRAVFLEMFGEVGRNTKGWRTAKLSTCFAKDREGTKCGPFGSALKREEYVDRGIPVWTMDNIQGFGFIPETALFITEDKYNQLSAYKAVTGDIIISRAGTVGKMCVVDTEESRAIISTNLIRLSLNEQVLDPYYFISLMQIAEGKLGRLQTGSDGAYTFMNTGILRELTIPIPAINKQREYRRCWIKRREETFLMSESLKGIETLLRSLHALVFHNPL